MHNPPDRVTYRGAQRPAYLPARGAYMFKRIVFFVGFMLGSGSHIGEGAPLRNAAANTAPVLLFHGDRDLNAPIVHPRRTHEALRSAARTSDLATFEELEQDLADSNARTGMLERIGRSAISGQLPVTSEVPATGVGELRAMRSGSSLFGKDNLSTAEGQVMKS